MTEIQISILNQARHALLMARTRCLLPGYYPDTMSDRLDASSRLLSAAMTAAKIAASILTAENADLATFLRQISTNRPLILCLSPSELEDRFKAVLEPAPVKEMKGCEPSETNVNV